MSIWPRVLVTGSDGQVGRALLGAFAGSAEVIACNRGSLDLSNPDAIRDKVREVAPDIIVNAGAYTAVDRAESEQDLAFAINGRAPGILAEEAQRASALLIHYSTDYVFNGSKSKPWVEDDATDPLSVYGASKLAGEEAIRRAGGRYLIFRTSWVYAPEGKNF
ncbi:MAG: NAD(P)-dependent oxidoreductase, partial [Terracidiphilus sp.]